MFSLRSTFSSGRHFSSFRSTFRFGRHFSSFGSPFHISGHSPEGECILPGRDRELEPLFAYLKEIRYSGDMIIEVYRSSYRSPDELWEAKQSLEKLAEQYGLAEPDRQVQNTSITQEETL